jgi:DNA invertase Pin-like site-specific DNA recombinase
MSDNQSSAQRQASTADQPVRRAAMYVRMSTDLQKYSTENQEKAIREYAVRRQIEIVTTYADEGKSGLNIQGREALQRLIRDVESDTANFNVILVLDVIRWGRFQDADESAYYEYICRRAGLEVQYVAEQFENDGSFTSGMIKYMKPGMAGEYSRELSCKGFAGQCRLIEKGYRQSPDTRKIASADPCRAAPPSCSRKRMSRSSG